MNADLIAAGRLILVELRRLAMERADFGFESTVRGRGYIEHFRQWKGSGYHIETIFLRLSSPRLTLKRIAARVVQGGHTVPCAEVTRRYTRGSANFENLYQHLADSWELYDNSGSKPVVLKKSP